MDEIQKFIVCRIYSLNEERHWSINQLASESGITQSTLSNIMSGKSAPNIKTIDEICKAYEISIARFFQGYNARVSDIVVERDEAELIQYYRLLPKNDQEKLVRITKEFVNVNEEQKAMTNSMYHKLYCDDLDDYEDSDLDDLDNNDKDE